MAALRFAALACVVAVTAQKCATPAPPPAQSFSLNQWFGAWFEIARIQTAGGNALQQFCACTQLIYSPTPNASSASDTTVVNSCRFENAGGFFLNATSYLTEGGSTGGHWSEQYFPGGPQASYNAIIAGTDARGVPYYVEYDCSIGILGQSNYCLHFLSREPLGFDQTLLQALVHNATVVMGLNPENRILNITTQDDGCWA